MILLKERKKILEWHTGMKDCSLVCVCWLILTSWSKCRQNTSESVWELPTYKTQSSCVSMIWSCQKINYVRVNKSENKVEMISSSLTKPLFHHIWTVRWRREGETPELNAVIPSRRPSDYFELEQEKSQLGEKVVVVTDQELFMLLVAFGIVLNAAYHNKSRDGQGVVDRVSEQRPAGQSDGLRHKETQRPYLTGRQWTG